MCTNPFDSSDTVRNARPLTYARSATFHSPLQLELGGQLLEVTVAFETYGRLNSQRDNAVLICHALSGDSHVARHDEADDPGWWDTVVGPGKPIDTDRFYVICPNILGGCRGTTGPNSVNPATGQRYATDFPVITICDIVEVQRQLIDYLGVERLLAVVGGSLGGHMVMTWATRFADRVAGAIAIATSTRLTSQALAFDVVGRNAILCDPDYHRGRYYDHSPGPVMGLAIARMLGHITYLSREAMMQKFDAQRLSPRQAHTQFETKFAVGSYLAHQGDRFGERFDANSYLTLTTAIDLFDLGDTREKVAMALGQSRCRWLVLSFTSDWLFPPSQSQEIVDSLIASDKPVSYCNVQSDCGHDAFLLPNQLGLYGELIRSFLANLRENEERVTRSEAAPSPASCPRALRPHEHLPPSQARLRNNTRTDPARCKCLGPRLRHGRAAGASARRGHQRIMGIEWDEQAILACIARGLDVVQADLNQGLSAFAHNQFDFVILSQTLQTVRDVPRVLRDLLRIGQRGIVSFPNVAYRKRRKELAKQGRTPRVHAEHGFQWHSTPYIRSLSIADFEDFCREQGIAIHRQIAMDTESDVVIHDNPNLNADVAVVVVSRQVDL